MSLDKKREGALGESYAAEYLQKMRYTIVDRNYRTRNGEIDIIAIDQGEKPSVLCFIEVKTRKSVDYGEPLEAIHFYKLNALVRTAEFYQATHRNLPESMRIDAIAIKLNDDDSLASIELVKNIS